MSATNRGAVRNAADFYPTPEGAFKSVLPLILKMPGKVWDPASGDGRLVRWTIEAGREAVGSDLYHGVDFLQCRYTSGNIIVTNPPFSLAFEFVQHANILSDHVVMLLRLNFLASQKRKLWFQQNPPTALAVLSKRPSFTGSGTDACDYAWVFWSNHVTGFFFL